MHTGIVPPSLNHHNKHAHAHQDTHTLHLHDQARLNLGQTDGASQHKHGLGALLRSGTETGWGAAHLLQHRDNKDLHRCVKPDVVDEAGDGAEGLEARAKGHEHVCAAAVDDKQDHLGGHEGEGGRQGKKM